MHADPRAVTLGLISGDGDQGFPGRVNVTCRYAMGPGNRLSVEYSAQTDAATPLNLSNHSYFNLDGSADLTLHRLVVHADRYTPVDKDDIPLGTILPVAGTTLDFRLPRAVMAPGARLDHNLCLNNNDGTLAPAAQLWSTASGLRMQIQTTKPGLQVYDGHKLPVGIGGSAYGPRAGICLEPQFFPDSPNNPTFPDSILRPGETYRQQTIYTFDHLPPAGI
jgi:aldose 1-epimerase